MAELYNPYSHALHDDPYPVYRKMRDDHPVYYSPEFEGFWALTRFADVVSALHDPARLVSGQGITLFGRNSYPLMITMDPPRHDELRSLVSRAFTPRRVQDIEPTARRIANQLLDEIVESGSCDLTPDFAAPLPTIVIADMLGVPADDRKQFRHWSDQLIQDAPDSPELSKAAAEASMALIGYFAEITKQRRAEPRDDLVTALVNAEIDGRRLEEDELLGFCFLLLVAGNETTTNLISNAALALDAYPDQRRALVQDPSLMPGAVEEFLRFDSPVQGLARTLIEDVEMHGVTMRAGHKVMLVFGAANRDERQFDRPDTLDVRRDIPRHLAFGHGLHFCLGAALARLEGRVALETLLARIPEFEVDSTHVERMHSGPIRGTKHLPMRFRPAQRAG